MKSPPDDFITSVRAVILNDERVLVVRDPESVHILPGGRRERGESLKQTLRREVVEETGWEIHDIRRLGIKHFHHLTPKPVGYLYPYPDFFQVIYRARPKCYRASARQKNGYELDATLVLCSVVQHLPLLASERLFLQAALQSMHT